MASGVNNKKYYVFPQTPKTNNGYNKKTTTRKTGGSSTSVVAKLSKDSYHTEILKGYVSHASANGKCVTTIPCGLNGGSVAEANFPQWANLKTKYSEFRVVYASATVVFSDQSKTVMSIVERDSAPIESKLAMVKDPLCKTHVIDTNQKQVFRGWKPSTSSDYDFQNTDLTGSIPAYIKLLQTDVPAAASCEVFLTLKVQFRNPKN